MWRPRSPVRAPASRPVCARVLTAAPRSPGGTAGISPTLDRGSFASCDLVIEAVIEDLALKKPLYEDIGRRELTLYSTPTHDAPQR